MKLRISCKTPNQIRVKDLLKFFKDKPDLYVGIDKTILGLTSNLHSYRGYYEDIALEYMPYQRPIHVSNIVWQLEYQIGEFFPGYKGGEYKLTKNSPVWISDYRSIGMAVTGIKQVSDNRFDLTWEKDGHCSPDWDVFQCKHCLKRFNK